MSHSWKMGHIIVVLLLRTTLVSTYSIPYGHFGLLFSVTFATPMCVPYVHYGLLGVAHLCKVDSSMLLIFIHGTLVCIPWRVTGRLVVWLYSVPAVQNSEA